MSLEYSLYDDITYLKGVGPKRAQKLKATGIYTPGDLLYYLPRKYLDRRNIKKIKQLRIGEEVAVIGKVISKNIKKTKKSRYFQLSVSDGTGTLHCNWFNGISWIMEKFNIEDQIAIFGKIEFYNGLKMMHPEFDLLDQEDNPMNTGQIISLYPSTSELKATGLDSRGIRKLIRNIFDEKAKYKIIDFLPSEIIKKEGLQNLEDSLLNIHFPQNEDSLDKAIYRIKFNEHFFIQMLMALKRWNIKDKTGIPFPKRGNYVKNIYDSLEFQLTEAQIRVLREIRADLKSDKPMNRLIQGDVGSGKTIVAMLAAAIVISEKYQVAVMAPTEILAEQHFNSFQNYCKPININCSILTSSKTQKEKNDILKNIKSGNIQLMIGTHALIQEKVIFNKLGMIIIDEQHRFGVEHRKLLIEKGLNPEVLAMTATPIPRTLSITLHGDMNISIIDELPKNRLPIKTKIIYPKKLLETYQTMKNEMDKGGQCFIVYPLIEESEVMDLEAADSGYEKLRKIFDQYKLGYINGRMKKEEIDSQMVLMKKGEIDCMVATTVIEVGVDIKNATIMLIENAERFGITQLHQLRGRIGRGDKQATCFLVQHKNTPLADRRLKIICETNDGFKISDEDLNIRGPGDFFGTKQHGFIKTKIVDFNTDGPIIRRARQNAFEIVAKDPNLNEDQYKMIKELFMKNYKHLLEFVKIG